MYFEGESINKNMDLSLHWSNLAIMHNECDDEELLTINFRICKILCNQKKYKELLKKATSMIESKNLSQINKDRCNIIIVDAHYFLKDGQDIEILKQLSGRQYPILEDTILKCVHEKLGNFYMENKNFKEAIDEYNKLIKLKEIDSHFYNNLGFAEEMCKNFDNAFRYYKLALEKESLISEKTSSFANFNLGYLYDNGLGVDKDSMHYQKGEKYLDEWEISREKFSLS